MKKSGIAHSIDTSNLDLHTKPGDDFYQFAVGDWLKKNPIPKSESRWAVFDIMREQNKIALRKILENLKKKQGLPQGSSGQKLRDYYTSGMDLKKRNHQGISPLRDELDAIEKIRTPRELLEYVAHLHTIGIDVLWIPYVHQDNKKSGEMILFLHQGGQGLPEKDYYLKNDADSRRIRQHYRQHLRIKMRLLGSSSADAQRAEEIIMKLETRLARASRTRTELRDVVALYNKKNLTALKTLAPSIDWNHYFNRIGIKKLQNLIVRQPEFLKEVSIMLKSISLADWKIYLRGRLAGGAGGYLSEKFMQEDFNFYGKVLSGAKELKPLWKRVVGEIDANMGEALGKIYVERHFPPVAKKQVNMLVDNLSAAYKVRIQSLEWMSGTTKKKALKKLGTFSRKLGYPEKWKDYQKLTISSESYLQNHFNAERFAFQQMIDKLGKPVDRGEWFMTAPTVNAYYMASLNEIVFPAGILQPPSFKAGGDIAVNYGDIGAVIGHEITHGFDDKGSLYDGNGNLKNWWTKQDRKKFMDKAQRLVKQFNETEVINGLYCNGELTLGENIADLGGVTIAYEALQKALKNLGPRGRKIINGFTPEQRFFLAYARAWMGNTRPEELKKQLRTDPHAPMKLRVNNIVANLPEFHRAFGINPGDTMYRSEKSRAKIW